MTLKTKAVATLIVVAGLGAAAASFVFPEYLRIPGIAQVPFKLGLDLQGGIHLIYEADLENVLVTERDEAMRGLREVIERRVNFFGIREPVVRVQGEGETRRLIVELAGVFDSNDAIELIGQTPFLEFRQYKDNYEEVIESNQEIAAGGEGEFEDPFEPTPLTGRFLSQAGIQLHSVTQEPLITLQFDEEGTALFEQLTQENIGRPLAMYLDGVPLQAPIVQEAISGGRAQITGQFTLEEAQSLIRELNSGALPVPIALVSQQSVGASLGEESLQQSLFAGLAGLLLVAGYMIVLYRVPGVVAGVSIAVYALALLALFKLIPVTLTLAGIAGAILSLGMAVDANILIFSRMKEEMNDGKSFGTALEDGFKRAWPSIRDGNITTLAVALILFWFGSSFVKGFALTLSLGIFVSLFSALFLTKNILRLFSDTRIARIIWLWK